MWLPHSVATTGPGRRVTWSEHLERRCRAHAPVGAAELSSSESDSEERSRCRPGHPSHPSHHDMRAWQDRSGGPSCSGKLRVAAGDSESSPTPPTVPGSDWPGRRAGGLRTESVRVRIRPIRRAPAPRAPAPPLSGTLRRGTHLVGPCHRGRRHRLDPSRSPPHTHTHTHTHTHEAHTTEWPGRRAGVRVSPRLRARPIRRRQTPPLPPPRAAARPPLHLHGRGEGVQGPPGPLEGLYIQ